MSITPVHILILAILAVGPGMISDARADAFVALPPGAKITASDLAANDELGLAADLDANTLVVGAHDNNDDGTHSGSAYVYDRNQDGAGNWGETRKLLASDADTGDEFGFDVAVRGDLIIVGAPYARGDDGAAYIFERDHGGAGNWGEIFKLTPVDGSPDEEFGLSVDIDGDYCVVGAHLNDAEASHSGAAYLFRRTGSGTSEWVQVTRLLASDAAINDEFGFDVAIDGDTVVVGSPMDTTTDQGSAYVFQRNQDGANAWGQVRRIASENIGSGDEFGTSVAIHGDRIVVGAPYEDTVAINGGAAYVFERHQNGANQWGQVAQLTATDGESNDRMGHQVAIYGSLVLAGAMEEDRTLLTGAGAAYLFFRNQGGIDTWNQAEKLVAYDATSNDSFGSAVTVGPYTAMVGAKDDNGGSTSSGSVYPFSLTFNNPPSIDDQVLSVPENSPDGTVVGTVIASPEDSGQSLGYTIASGNTGGAFSLGEASGILRVANDAVLDHEIIPQFVLEVDVTDTGEPVLKTRGQVTINLSDIPEDADLSVTTTASGTGFAGDPLTYRIRVKNDGPLVAGNVVVRDVLPADVFPSGTITTPLRDLEPGEFATFTIDVLVNRALTAPLTNRVTATMDTPDPDVANNSFTLVTPITPVADLSVVKTAPELIAPGNSIFYSIVVSNAGPSDAVNVSVADTLPPGLTTSGILTNLIAAISPGTIHFVGISVQSDGAYLGELTNRVSVSSNASDLNLANNTAEAVTTVNYIADLGLSKTGPALVTDTNRVQYVLSVTNYGPGPARDVVITDFLPAGMTFDPAGSDLLCAGGGSNVVCSLASLPIGGMAVLAVQGTLDPTTTGTVVNVATVTASTIDANPSNDLASAATVLPDADGDGQADFADPDDDNDAIPDDWEIRYGLNRYADDAGADPDEDGATNLDEYIADTVPTDGLSYLFVSRITPATVIEFDSSSNRVYSLEYTAELPAAGWLSVPGQTLVPGLGGPQRFTNSVPDPQRHYRIRAQVP